MISNTGIESFYDKAKNWKKSQELKLYSEKISPMHA